MILLANYAAIGFSASSGDILVLASGTPETQFMYKGGYLVASSLVEKAADLVVAKRFLATAIAKAQKKKQGMHWTLMGADNLCALHTLWLNGDWEDYWRERREKAA